MDCLQLRQPAGPFHYLISEQAKSLVALQELQHEVGALLEFRDLVIETFPNLRTKLGSTPATMTTHSHIPVAVRRDWEPGIRVRRKLHSKDDARSKKTELAIQDSGFSTETSSKETHSASSSTALPNSAPVVTDDVDPDPDRDRDPEFDPDDELWHLLDIIHRKGTRLKEEVESLQGALRPHINEDGDFQRALFHSSADDVRQLRHERDLLLDRVAEMEAEVLTGRIHTSRLQDELEALLTTKHDLEEQLKAVVTQRGEVNSRIHDLHLQFVGKSGPSLPDVERPRGSGAGGAKRDLSFAGSSHGGSPARGRPSGLDSVLGTRIPKVKFVSAGKVKAILSERDPVALQRHLLISAVENEDLHQKLDSASRLEGGLVDRLEKAREENEDLRSQLDCKEIELEGTKAQLRVLEQRSRPSTGKSPDIIPTSDSASDLGQSRSEITTASMKAMGPLPLNLQLDSSSTESAQDQEQSKRRKPSKIPLGKGFAPKPPGGNRAGPPGGARSRSGESHSSSAQSWRKSDHSLSAGKSRESSLHKSRNGSLGHARDSLKRHDSATNLVAANSFGSSRKSPAVRRAASIRDSPESKVRSKFWNWLRILDSNAT